MHELNWVGTSSRKEGEEHTFATQLTESSFVWIVHERAPDEVDNDQRWRQGRFLIVLSGETVPVKTPRLEALLLDPLISIAANIPQDTKLSYELYVCKLRCLPQPNPKFSPNTNPNPNPNLNPNPKPNPNHILYNNKVSRLNLSVLIALLAITITITLTLAVTLILTLTLTLICCSTLSCALPATQQSKVHQRLRQNLDYIQKPFHSIIGKLHFIVSLSAVKIPRAKDVKLNSEVGMTRGPTFRRQKQISRALKSNWITVWWPRVFDIF